MKELIKVLILGLVMVVTLSIVADLHCRVIELEAEIEYMRSHVQELQEAVFESDNIIEIAPGGWIRLTEE